MPNGKPYQSKLNPYRREIAELRATRPPTPYERIAEILKDRHGIGVTGHTVWAFVKSRSKGRKVYAMQLEDEPAPQAPPPVQPVAAPAPLAKASSLNPDDPAFAEAEPDDPTPVKTRKLRELRDQREREQREREQRNQQP